MPERLVGLRVLGCLAACAPAVLLHAHGTPIRVDVVDNRLTVSGGLADVNGFAPQVFSEANEFGEPEFTANLPVFGSSLVWVVPGFDLHGLATGSGLFVEPLLRPVQGSNPPEERLLWHWDAATEAVAVAPHQETAYLLSVFGSAVLAQQPAAAPPPLKIANPVAADQIGHNHDLLRYALDLQPAPGVEPPSIGAYGLFARLTSNVGVYDASDPFLIVFNRGIDYAEMIPAALAINAAAADPAEFPPGDYDRSGTVGPEDYDRWRDDYGQLVMPLAGADGNGDGVVDVRDYAFWREHLPPPGSGATAFAEVPEPSAALLALAAVLSVATAAGRSRRNSYPQRNPDRK